MTITTNIRENILFSMKQNASIINNTPPTKEKMIRYIIINFRLFSGRIFKVGMIQKIRETIRKLIAKGHRKLCSSNRNSQPNNENKVTTQITIGVIHATNKLIRRLFSFCFFSL